ncbi:MAG: dihydroneopterin aldolase [Gammaproteobacteria bacterium]|jgi:dihydroneopterin aldolase|nr:dihydroneopterin aldolase [Gammaproteobacteria bacterium]
MAVVRRDILIIRKLALKTAIGIYPYEKKIKQTVLLDLELDYDSRQAGASDDLKDAWDYSALVEDLRVLLGTLQCNLIESLADKICSHILKTYSCNHVRLTLVKPHALAGSTEVGLTVERFK